MVMRDRALLVPLALVLVFSAAACSSSDQQEQRPSSRHRLPVSDLQHEMGIVTDTG